MPAEWASRGSVVTRSTVMPAMGEGSMFERPAREELLQMLQEVVSATPWVEKYGMENQFGVGQASHIRTLCVFSMRVGAKTHDAR